MVPFFFKYILWYISVWKTQSKGIEDLILMILTDLLRKVAKVIVIYCDLFNHDDIVEVFFCL